MSKANRLLVAALVVQVAILVIAHVVQTEPHTQQPKPVLGPLDSDSITRIKVVDDDKTAVLERQGETWVLASGGGYPVKEEKVKELVSKFPGLMATSPVATKPEFQRALEVSAEENQRDITLTLKDGKSLRFFLGSSPGIKKVHLRLDGQNDVYAVEGLSTWDIGATPTNWVDTEYLKLDKDKVVALTLKNEHGALVATKVGGQWQVEGAGGKQVKQSAVDSLVSSVSSIQLNEPIGKEVKPEYGLAQPKAVVTIVSEKAVEKAKKEDGEAAASQPSEPQQTVRETHVLTLGAKQGEDGYYAKSDTSPYVVRLANWTAETFLNKKLSDLLEEPKKEEAGQAKKTGSEKPKKS